MCTSLDLLSRGDYVSGASDIDIVAVSRDRLGSRAKQDIAESLLAPAMRCPARGVEFTLYRREVAGAHPSAAISR